MSAAPAVTDTATPTDLERIVQLEEELRQFRGVAAEAALFVDILDDRLRAGWKKVPTRDLDRLRAALAQAPTFCACQGRMAADLATHSQARCSWITGGAR